MVKTESEKANELSSYGGQGVLGTVILIGMEYSTYTFSEKWNQGVVLYNVWINWL